MAGIKLTTGGTVTNPFGKTITGYNYGVEIYGGTGAVTNKGTIAATAKYSRGVILEDGGTVTNSGLITGGGEGVRLEAGGVVINQAGGTIDNVYILGGTGAVKNAGKITHGVWLQTMSTVSNAAGATITGYDSSGYGVGLHAGGSVTNAGKIAGKYVGVEADDGGVITNKATGTIKGHYAGILMGFPGQPNGGGGSLTNAKGGAIDGESGVIAGGGVATVTNAGSIVGATSVTITKKGITLTLGDGVSLSAGGSVTNQAGGSIKGARYGVYVSGAAGAVTNAGTISGKAAAVDFAGAGANTLTLETGSVLVGSVIGSTATGATNALALEGHGIANNVFLHFDTLSVEANGTWKLGGGSPFAEVTVSSGALDLTAAATGTGTDTISGAATLEFGSTVANTQTIDFTSSQGVLDLGSPTGFSGVIGGFDTVGTNDAVELLGSWKISGYTQTNATEGRLTLKHGSETASLVFDDTYSETLFHAKVGAGHTTITYG
jgi:hypothetical protein